MRHSTASNIRLKATHSLGQASVALLQPSIWLRAHEHLTCSDMARTQNQQKHAASLMVAPHVQRHGCLAILT